MTEQNTVIFYANPNCPYAQRSWLALKELQVNFSYQNIELGKDNKTEWFLKLNPNGTVPVIQQGDVVVYESLVVNEYLQEVFSNERVSLLPNEASLRAHARILIARCDAKFTKLAYSYLSNKIEEKDKEIEQALTGELEFIDTALGKFPGSYFLGEKLSLVDIAYMPFFERMLVALNTWKGFDIRSLNLQHLNHWLDAMENRATYSETRMTPEKIKEVYARFLGIDYFKKVGIASASTN